MTPVSERTGQDMRAAKPIAPTVNGKPIEGGHATQTGFQDYPLLTIAESPEIEVDIVPNRADPTGAGESGVPPPGGGFAGCRSDPATSPLRLFQINDPCRAAFARSFVKARDQLFLAP